MSPTVNNFVHDLVAMAKAMEDLPQVQAELAETKARLDAALQAVQDREVTILTLKDNVQQYIAKVRSTEAERDDAEMRFLESEDRTRSALDFIKTTFGSAGSLIQALEPPPKVEPVAEVKPEAEPIPVEQSPYYNAPAQGQSAADPMLGNTPESPAVISQDTGSSWPKSLPVTSFEEVPKSDANPTANAVDNGHAPSVVQSEPVGSTDDVGYHNEPDVGTDWTAWNAWCERMRQRYGTGAWPQRPDNAAPSVA